MSYQTVQLRVWRKLSIPFPSYQEFGFLVSANLAGHMDIWRAFSYKHKSHECKKQVALSYIIGARYCSSHRVGLLNKNASPWRKWQPSKMAVFTQLRCKGAGLSHCPMGYHANANLDNVKVDMRMLYSISLLRKVLRIVHLKISCQLRIQPQTWELVL